MNTADKKSNIKDLPVKMKEKPFKDQEDIFEDESDDVLFDDDSEDFEIPEEDDNEEVVIEKETSSSDDAVKIYLQQIAEFLFYPLMKNLKLQNRSRKTRVKRQKKILLMQTCVW